MGALQQSINAALRTATTAAALSRGAVYYDNQKEVELNKEKAELTKAENERIAGQQSVVAQAQELQKKVQENQTAGSELDLEISKAKSEVINAFGDAKKTQLAQARVRELQKQKKIQKVLFESRMEGFRKENELINQRGALYGMEPIDVLNEGGKK